jgi:site-specific recombinase XerD
VVEDRLYTSKEIDELFVSAYSKRDRAIILLLASSGIRIRGLLNLELKHPFEIPK